MKKLYAILMAAVLVLGLSTAAFAATESFAASVELKYDLKSSAFTGTNTATMLVDYTKVFSDDISAGLVGKIDFAPGGGVSIVDGYGWIKVSNILGMFTLTAATAKVTAAGGNILGAFALVAGEGIYLDANFDPLFATLTLNDDGFGLKGTYADAVFGFGASYASELFGGDYGFGVWGSATLTPFSAKAEYDYNDDFGNYAYLIEGAYADTDLGITAVVGVEGNDGWDFDAAMLAILGIAKPDPLTMIPTDHFTLVDWYMDSHYEYMYDAGHHQATNVYGSIAAAVVPGFTVSVKGNYLADDDEFSVSGNIKLTPTPELTFNVGGGYAVDAPGWGEFYKIYGDVAYMVTPALKLSANAGYYYSDFGGGDGFKLGAGVNYNFIAGVDGYATFEYYDETWHNTDGWVLTVGLKAVL